MAPYSKRRPSKLIQLFTQRAGGERGSDPGVVLGRLLAVLRKRTGWSRKRPQLERALELRGIRQTEYRMKWDRDGSLEPLGTTFDQGFKMTLNARVSENRARFTQAHELCHTYFYEYVPEIKLRPHVEDQLEEQLCNMGAAELLMPRNPLKKEASEMRPSMQELLRLAADYRVSPEAMVLRLRSIRVWNCELHLWRRETSGDFVLDQVSGARWLPWKWCDKDVPTVAWFDGRCSGTAYLECEIRPGHKHYKVVSFDAKRHGTALMVLSGASPMIAGAQRSLFHSSSY